MRELFVLFLALSLHPNQEGVNKLQILKSEHKSKKTLGCKEQINTRRVISTPIGKKYIASIVG